MFPLFNCKVRLGGSVMNEVRKSGVTAPEVLILRELHGADAISDIVETDEKAKRTHMEERERLYAVYANPEQNNPEQVAKKTSMIRNLFGHDAIDLPQRLPDAVKRAANGPAKKPDPLE